MARQLPRVLVGDDGVLYLTGGANDVLDLYQPGFFEANCPWAEWRERIGARARFFADAGISWRMLLAPEKLSVLGPAQLARALGTFAVPGDVFAARFAPHVISVRSHLAEQSCGCYTRTDSHWTGAGALSAFRLVAASLGLDPDYRVFSELLPLDLRFHGDLWSPELATIEPDTFRRYHVPSAVQIVYANPIVGYKIANGLENEAGLHAGSHIIVRNDRAQFQQTLVLFGSSFSEYRLECGLLSFVCALLFRTVHFIWSADLDFDYIARHRPDFVLIEMPERFLLSCPRDAFGVEEHAIHRLAAFRASRPSA